MGKLLSFFWNSYYYIRLGIEFETGTGSKIGKKKADGQDTTDSALFQ